MPISKRMSLRNANREEQEGLPSRFRAAKPPQLDALVHSVNTIACIDDVSVTIELIGHYLIDVEPKCHRFGEHHGIALIRARHGQINAEGTHIFGTPIDLLRRRRRAIEIQSLTVQC